jgi:hypothetical protein
VPEYLIADVDPARFRGAGDAQDDRILGLSAEPAQDVTDVPRTTCSYAPISRFGGLDKLAPTPQLES